MKNNALLTRILALPVLILAAFAFSACEDDNALEEGAEEIEEGVEEGADAIEDGADELD